MRAYSLGFFGLVALTIGACSGKAVVDGPMITSSGSGGSTSSGTTSTTSSGTGSTSTSTTGTGGAPVTCELLEAELEDRWLAARECDPTIYMAQCTGELMVYDQCGCEWAANVNAPEKAAAALVAYDDWVDLGCGPWDCAYCPMPLPASCEAGPSGNTGICVPLAN
jgi:hypothetical protein